MPPEDMGHNYPTQPLVGHKKALTLEPLYPEVATAASSTTTTQVPPDYGMPSPTQAAVNEIFIPGGGWFYLGMTSKREEPDDSEFSEAVFSIIASAVAIMVARRGLMTNNSGQFLGALGGFWVVRWFMVDTVVSEAERRDRSDELNGVKKH